MEKKKIGLMVCVLAVVLIAGVAQAQVYTYDGSQDIYGPLDDFDSLDGTWDHNNDSDEWDGTGPGTGRPGGVMVLTEGSDTFLRLQDTGDPRDYGMADPGSNRKSRFGHKLNSMIVLDDGCTLEFRARIATTSPLDDMHPDGGSGIVPWPAGGKGYLGLNGGNGTIGIAQQHSGGIISFSLVTAADMEEIGLAPVGGLIMNNLNGTVMTDEVDTGDAGTLNLLPLDDPTVWHAFKIDIAPGGTGTHVVDVYVDDAIDPVSFDVTIGNSNGKATYEDFSFLTMGHSNTGASGSIDIDYVTFIPNMTVDAGDYQSILWQDPAVAQLDATVNDGGPSLTYTWTGPAGVSFSPSPNVEDPCAIFTAVGVYELRLSVSDGELDACDVLDVHVRATDAPVAYWTFENNGTGTGTNVVVDRSPNNNFGTFAGDPEPNWVSGWVGDYALDVAANSYVKITTDPVADPNLNAMYGAVTVSAWVKVDDWLSTSWTGIVTLGSGSGGTNPGGWLLMGNGGTGSLAFSTPGAGFVEGSVNVKDDYWHHVVGVHDGTTISLYVDGVLDTAEDADGLVIPKVAEVWINGSSEEEGGLFFDGQIDDVQIYNYAISESKIAELLAMGQGFPPQVYAGLDATFYVQNGSYQLAATVEDDTPPQATLLWTKEDGPGTVEFSNATIEDPTVTFSEVGEYTLRLTADDPLADVDDEVIITVENPTCNDAIIAGLGMPADLSGPAGDPDCYVDLHDFAAFAGSWLRCNDPQNSECDFPY